MRIFGPLVCSTTLAETVAEASASAAVVRSSPSTSSTGTSEISSPGAPSIFSTVTTSSTATLYCLPPVLTIAYMDALLQSSGDVVRVPSWVAWSSRPRAAAPVSIQWGAAQASRVRNGFREGQTGSPALPAAAGDPGPPRRSLRRRLAVGLGTGRLGRRRARPGATPYAGPAAAATPVTGGGRRRRGRASRRITGGRSEAGGRRRRDSALDGAESTASADGAVDGSCGSATSSAGRTRAP